MESSAPKATTTTISVRLQPKASRNAVSIEADGRIRISVTAPPVEGAANEALIAFLSEILRIARRQLHLVRGEKSRDKHVCVQGLDRETILGRLGAHR